MVVSTSAANCLVRLRLQNDLLCVKCNVAQLNSYFCCKFFRIVNFVTDCACDYDDVS